MPKLSLMFENKLVKEVPIGTRPVGIGRSPDNDLPVDNLAVSNHHARVFFEAGRLVELPVPMYRARRAGSMVGVFQIAPPDGAQSSVPSTFLPAGLGSSGMMEVFQI